MNFRKEEGKKSSLTQSEQEILDRKGYKLIKLIGQGDWAQIFLSEMQVPGKPKKKVACKIVDLDLLPENFKPYVLKEIEFVTKLIHPNIVHIFSIYHQKNKYLLFMRYAEKGDLHDFILNHEEIPEIVMKFWIFQILVAVQYLHAINISHRDINCENILITENYNVKLTDFGWLKYDYGKNVETSTFCGSTAYAAPEILRGKPYLPKPTDIWSIGVVLFISLNNAVPFPGSDNTKILKKQFKKDWSFTSKTLPKVSQDVISLVQRLLEPDFKNRPTADELIDDKWFSVDGEKFVLTDQQESLLAYAKIRQISKDLHGQHTHEDILLDRRYSVLGYYLMENEKKSFESIKEIDSESLLVTEE